MQALTVERASTDLARLGALVLALVAAFMLSGNAHAGGPTISGEDVAVAPGSAFAYTVTAHSEAPIAAFGIDILFDEDQLTAHSCQSSLALCNKAAQPGKLRLNGVSLAGFSGDFTFATVVFEAVGPPGPATVDIQVTALADTELNDLTDGLTVSDGTVLIDESAGMTPLGDANCDSVLSAGDGLAIIGDLAGTTVPECLPIADVNCDGKVNIQDALAILRAVAGLPLDLPPGCSALS